MNRFSEVARYKINIEDSVVFLLLAKNIPKIKLRKLHLQGMKRYRIFRNKLNKSTRLIHWKLHHWKKLKKKQINGKTSMFRDWKTILLRWQYSQSWSIDSTHSLSKSQVPFLQKLTNWSENSYRNVKIRTVKTIS